MAHDNSESIGLVSNIGSDSTIEYINRFDSFYNKLSAEYSVNYIGFGEKLTDTLNYAFDNKETDFTQLFEKISTRFINYNVGAVILASDGIYNKGIDPLYKAKLISYPFYTIALGDTVKKRDLIIKNAYSNKIAFLGDYFPVEIHLNAIGFKGEIANVKIFHKGELVVQKAIEIKSTDFSELITFDIKASHKGLQAYNIVIEPKKGEFSIENNSQTIVVDIVDNKKKILILSNSFHPDVGAIKNALKSNNNLMVESSSFDLFKGSIKEYQLVIFYQLPGKHFNNQKMIQELDKNKIPVFYVIGTQNNITQYNFIKLGNSIEKNNNLTERVFVSVNQNFKLFEPEEKLLELVNDCPPLIAPFGNYKLDKNYEVLFNQKIKGVKTNKPLLMFDNSLTGQNAKKAFLFGEGVWRWRMRDYILNKNHEQFDSFINKIIQFLALDIKKERFMVYHENIINENQDFFIRAELYNQAYDLTNEPEVSFELVDNENKSFKYSFDKSDKSYNLNLGQLPQGLYNYSARTEFEGKQYLKNGQIRIVPVNVEHQDLTANHNLLKQLSLQSNGKMFYPDELDQLLAEIQQSKTIKPVSNSIVDLVDLVELKWIFFLLIGFLTIEWFVRKFYGAY